MVKGSSRQVILVKSPDETLFEQAIFFVKEEAFRRQGVTADSVVAEAQKIAKEYSKRDSIFHESSGVHGLLWILLGASASSLCWALGLYYFMSFVA